MRKGLVLLAAALVALAGIGFGLYGLLDALKSQGGFWHEAWRVLFGTPPTLYRGLQGFTVVAVLLALLLSPIALMETRSLRAYARLEEELRRERPDAVMTPYAGEEGDGVAFDGPEGRVLLLRPAWGIGAPVVVRPQGQAAPSAERPPAEGS